MHFDEILKEQTTFRVLVRTFGLNNTVNHSNTLVKNSALWLTAWSSDIMDINSYHKLIIIENQFNAFKD